MAETQFSEITMNPKNGYCTRTKVYHSLRPAVSLPPPSQPLSIVQYVLSLRRSPTTAALSTTPFIIDSATGHRLTYSTFLRQVASLSSSLKSLQPSLAKHAVAFILSPPSLHIPVLYFSLLSLGVVISPSEMFFSPSELNHQIHHQIQLSKPVIAFATSETSRLLPPNTPTILLDSPEFLSMLEMEVSLSDPQNDIVVNQSDAAAILYSSGTTGRTKGVVLTHRNMIARIAEVYHNMMVDQWKDENGVHIQPISLFSMPMSRVFGLSSLIMAVALGESLVLLEKLDLVKMLEAVEKYRVSYIPVAAPVLVAMVKSELVSQYDLSSVQSLFFAAAPLGKEVIKRFMEKYPHLEISQGYGLTEGGGATRAVGPEEMKRYGTVGLLSESFEAKIVHPQTGLALPPGQRGELCLRGPQIMKGYAGDEAATAAALDSEGWLKTGDLCYFDEDGFLFVVGRLNELIKYKGYQVPPVELEHLLQAIPEIDDVAVVPYADEEAGEIPMAYIVRKPCSTISASQIMDFIAKQVPPYKRIRRVAFIDSIPKCPSGKILRRELVNHALAK